MVNYKYVLEDIERNNQQYLTSGAIAVSPGVLRLLSSLPEK